VDMYDRPREARSQQREREQSQGTMRGLESAKEVGADVAVTEDISLAMAVIDPVPGATRHDT
jgi:hypothetical protein